MKITEIRTFLMHAGAPNLKTWAADGSFGTQAYSKNLTRHAQLAVREGRSPTRASPASASARAGRA